MTTRPTSALRYNFTISHKSAMSSLSPKRTNTKITNNFRIT